MLSSKTSIKLSKALLERARLHSEKAGYSSVDEFVQHVLERELAKLEEATSRDDIEAKLKGLGYLE
jgi:Arc/MetJ-type ribon-helix-helix transcriptional regulator